MKLFPNQMLFWESREILWELTSLEQLLNDYLDLLFKLVTRPWVQESSGIKTEMTVNRGSGTKKDKFSTEAIALGLSLA